MKDTTEEIDGVQTCLINLIRTLLEEVKSDDHRQQTIKILQDKFHKTQIFKEKDHHIVEIDIKNNEIQ